MVQKSKKSSNNNSLPKTPTGITGFDEITDGGIPTGRPTLVCGMAGAGKTLFSIEFIVKGILEYNEPGVIMAFEEKKEELEMNVVSLGFDLKKLQKQGLLRIDHVHIERSEIEETGEYDLDGLFIRLGHAIDSIGAKRVMLDTIENLFAGLNNEGIIRAELRRLFTWLKDRGVTAMITAEKGEGMLTRQGLEEYVSDCVILLEHRVIDKISTRLLRVVKFRGSLHGTNEYPFLIDEDGISVLPVTSLKLNHVVTKERIRTGVPALDNMLGGKGFFRGSSILISGTAGTGKTSLAAIMADASCSRKERSMFFAFEESPQQIIRNMESIGINLQQHIDSGYLQMYASRPTTYGLEMHLVSIHKKIRQYKPSLVVLDPITNLITIGSMAEVKSILIRLIDFLQIEQITVVFTALNSNVPFEQTDQGISSLVDSWIQVRDLESDGERNRGMYIMKSRGMDHSNQVREFVITDHGVDLVDVVQGPGGVVTGSKRREQQLREMAGVEMKQYEVGLTNKEIERKKKVLEAKIASLQEEFESVKDVLNKSFEQENFQNEVLAKKREELSKSTGVSNGKNKRK
ncbi:MAG TPA: circadian clock protein KaiC [Flavitalea sp.]|nr:circadian clock protein KaiC [Flavitalea sp.]